MFFGKFWACWLYYVGRACCVNEVYYDNGVLFEVVMCYYVLIDMELDINGDTCKFEVKDIFDLVDDKNVVCLFFNNGELLIGIGIGLVDVILILIGIGDFEYVVSGCVIIGLEIVLFICIGDVFMLIGWGLNNMEVFSYSVGDSV